MNYLGASLIAALAALALYQFSKKSQPASSQGASLSDMLQYTAYNMQNSLDSVYQKYGAMYDIPWQLIKAVAIVESGENPNIKNPADPSYGLMQILCVDDGAGGCSNRFPAVPNWPPDSKQTLYNPDYNVSVGTQILAWNIKTYGFWKGVAVYNRWASRNESEPFANQSYVDKVRQNYYQLTKSV